ncbi:MAG: anti-phage DNA glycosylase Brig1 [Actinomycetes bacterium]
MTSSRQRVADFWDEHLNAWLSGDEPRSPALAGWQDSYRGTGHGEVDLSCYPDPYTGDLRGTSREPRMVVLGLNPGVGYRELQGRNPLGEWSRRIAATSYSQCLDRIPHQNAAWGALHGKDSPYWTKMVNFARRWCDDPTLDARDILNMELYPWHSNGIHGSAITPPAALIDEFVWQPVSETTPPQIFAFGADWRRLCTALGLEQIAWYGPGHCPLADPTKGRWNVVVYAMPSGQRAIVSWQLGSGSPPGTTRLPELRRIVAEHR